VETLLNGATRENES